MKKSSPRKNIKRERPNAVAEDSDFTALRQKIRNRVGQEALGMIESTINGVNNGQYAALKYLFEAIGLFPANISDESRQQDVLAPSLLRALGIPEVPVSEHAVTKDSVKS
jgi:hypothetical protein